MATLVSQQLSRTVYTADGVTTSWNFSFSGGYLDPSHVAAYSKSPLGEVTELPVTLIGPYQVGIYPAVALGDTVVIYRNTPKDLPLVDFADGAGFSEASLDVAAKQAVFLAAERAEEELSLTQGPAGAPGPIGPQGPQGVPGASGSGTGDMVVATYDTNSDGKVDSADYADAAPWAGITGKPTTFSPASHTHTQADVTGLDTALAGKQAVLVSGTNIKTVNGQTLVGAGNLALQQVYVQSTDPGAVGAGSIWVQP